MEGGEEPRKTHTRTKEGGDLVRPDQNELWERYEDAMFTLLMDEVAHQEGQEQLEWKKQLNDDPSAALPEEVRKKGEQTIRKAFAAQSS